jgi:hypothetical protein
VSDTSQGPGWWRASNGLWYPPEAKPGPRPTSSGGAWTGSGTGESVRRPPGVPDRPAADPNVQPPFTLRPFEPLELDRDRDHRVRRHDDDGGRRIRWGWVGVVILVLLFGGVGTWLALTASDGRDEAATTTTAAPTSTTVPTTTATTAPTTTTAADDEVSVFALATGDCFDAGPGDGADEGEVVLSTVAIVDCDEPHLAEVIAVATFPDDAGEPFPGAASRDTAAQALCTPAFEATVGVPLASSELGLVWFAPTQQTWEDEDDRVVTCAAQSVDGEPLVGTVAGSGR